MSVPIYTAEEMQAILSVYEAVRADQTKYETLIACHGHAAVREQIAEIACKIDAAFDASLNSDVYADCYDLVFIPLVVAEICDPFNITDEGIVLTVELVLAKEAEAGQ